jgi:hypothetical protein
MSTVSLTIQWDPNLKYDGACAVQRGDACHIRNARVLTDV